MMHFSRAIFALMNRTWVWFGFGLRFLMTPGLSKDIRCHDRTWDQMLYKVLTVHENHGQHIFKFTLTFFKGTRISAGY